MFDMYRQVRLVIGCGLLSLALGCSGDPYQRYEPETSVARKAIDSALSAWKAGAAYGPVQGAKPEINVFDARWQAGKKLESFEILDEVKDQQHPQYKVKIKLAGAREEVNQYLVVGIDPLLVFRDSDYQRASGM